MQQERPLTDVGKSPTASAPANVPRGSPILFFALVLVFAVPFWILGGLTGILLLPGLPVAALMVCCPVLAAAILTYRETRWAGVGALLRRSFDFRRFPSTLWYLPTLLLVPAMMVLAFFVQRLTGTDVPTPQFSLLSALALAVVFFVGALGEELGWSGYAIGPLQARWGALRASLALGAFWAVFHYVALAQAGRSLEWVAWWTVFTVATRVIMVWLFNNTGGSVFATALYHMMGNLTWQLYPVNGSYLDERIIGIITALVAVAIVLVWGPRTLAHADKGDKGRA